MGVSASCQCTSTLCIAGAEVTYTVAADDATSVHLDAKHITGVEEAKVSADGVHPEAVLVLWVADANVTGCALSEAHTSPVPEDSGHMKADMLPMLFKGVKGRDPYLGQHSGGSNAGVAYSPERALGPRLISES